jgi:GrpB-like predicted nucleotidyltransferase (UPF0157 family)
MSTEKRLRKVTIGEPAIHNDVIRLVDYDPNWPALFEREAGRIGRALGERALRIEHVGSTAVPGLVAKPIVDVVLVVADSADEGAYAPALEAAGYVLRIREPKWHQHRLFKGPDSAINLHVFRRDCSEVKRMLSFRDRLREHEADRALYARTKQRLAQQRWQYVQDYADNKTAVVEAILARVASVAARRPRDRSGG